jgi:GAF domain
VLGVPLLREGNPIGVFVLTRSVVQPFDAKQIELITTFADQAVIAIENTRLLSELRQRTDDLSESLEQQTATSEVLKVISSSPGELEPVFSAMLANATRICEATFGNLFLREGPTFRCVAVHSKESDSDSWRRNPVVDLRDHPFGPHSGEQLAPNCGPPGGSCGLVISSGPWASSAAPLRRRRSLDELNAAGL